METFEIRQMFFHLGAPPLRSLLTNTTLKIILVTADLDVRATNVRNGLVAEMTTRKYRKQHRFWFSDWKQKKEENPKAKAMKIIDCGIGKVVAMSSFRNKAKRILEFIEACSTVVSCCIDSLLLNYTEECRSSFSCLIAPEKSRSLYWKKVQEVKGNDGHGRVCCGLQVLGKVMILSK
ncbi:hypothetical protein HID58_088392 [Brassica napus]|uniref:Uncharacterized protein n=1 Tax=Brassica napus TaxID=3708 RepID=A0ABQ7XW37_BRANA|nr:hypothetical protein HID58_088392 [Brassica napus]